MNESIVITGIGMATPYGLGKEASWEKIKNGICITSTPVPENLNSDLASFAREVPFIYPVGNYTMKHSFHLQNFVVGMPSQTVSKGINRNGLPRIFPLTFLTAKEAMEDSGIKFSELQPERIGCSVSVSKPILYIPQIPDSPLFSILYFSPDSVGQFLCKELGIQGPRQNLVAACATGVHSIFAACRWLKEDSCDIAIAGSAESSLHPLYISCFYQMGVLSDFPCPFDRRRNGFVLGEGAGILVLERKKDALARRAKIVAEILGCEIGADTAHPMAFDSEGISIVRVLNRILKNCKISEKEVDYINLHGTGTKINDLIETRAIKKVFGKSAYHLSLSSTKASTGHLLGAAASVEAELTSLAMCDQFVPPTASLEIPDPECDLDYTPKTGKSKKIETALSLSFGFGGTIGTIALKKID